MSMKGQTNQIDGYGTDGVELKSTGHLTLDFRGRHCAAYEALWTACATRRVRTPKLLLPIEAHMILRLLWCPLSGRGGS